MVLEELGKGGFMNKDYIDMCEQSKELQELRGPDLWQEGDFVTDKVFKDWENNRAPRCYFVHTDESDEPYQMYNPVWLPRQDQLQQLMYEKLLGHNISLRAVTLPNGDTGWVGEFQISNVTAPVECPQFMGGCLEEIWLQLFMFINHNKIWKSGKWAKKK